MDDHGTAVSEPCYTKNAGQSECPPKKNRSVFGTPMRLLAREHGHGGGPLACCRGAVGRPSGRPA